MWYPDLKLRSLVQCKLMLPVMTVMYTYVTVTAIVCNSSNDSDKTDMDAPEIIKERKGGNLVVLYS